MQRKLKLYERFEFSFKAVNRHYLGLMGLQPAGYALTCRIYHLVLFFSVFCRLHCLSCRVYFTL